MSCVLQMSVGAQALRSGAIDQKAVQLGDVVAGTWETRLGGNIKCPFFQVLAVRTLYNAFPTEIHLSEKTHKPCT